MNDPQENDMKVGVMSFGPTGANNDVVTPTSGATLESMLSGAPEVDSNRQPNVTEQNTFSR